MTSSVVAIGILIAVAVALFAYWRNVIRQHHGRIDQLDVRIHVNGIRGKSSVTRLVAGVLRERHGVAKVIIRRKEFYSKPAAAALIDEMAQEVEVAVAAVGG